MRSVAAISLLGALLGACAPTATGPQPQSSPWRDRGEVTCAARGPLPAEDPPCDGVISSPVAVWLNGRVIPLREALSSIIVVGLSPATVLACDESRFPLPRTCMARVTCEGADVVVMSAYVTGVMREVATRGCW